MELNKLLFWRTNIDKILTWMTNYEIPCKYPKNTPLKPKNTPKIPLKNSQKYLKYIPKIFQKKTENT